MVCRRLGQLAGLVLAAGLLIGCALRERDLHYLGDAELKYYKDAATQIDYPHVHEPVRLCAGFPEHVVQDAPKHQERGARVEHVLSEMNRRISPADTVLCFEDGDLKPSVG